MNKILYSIQHIKKSFILVDDYFLYNLFGIEDGNKIEITDTLDDYINENIEDGFYSDDEIKLIKDFQEIIKNELKNNDVVQIIKRN